MAYDGQVLYICILEHLKFHRAYAVTVSGGRLNPCGHMIACFDGGRKHYFHIAGFYSRPKYMDENGYARYLRENGKSELRREVIHLEDIDASVRKIHELLSKPWAWGVLPNNCAHFVEEVFQAGGAQVGSYSNCPTLEDFSF